MIHDYRTVPPGTYLCEVAEVRPGKTRDGSVRWSLRLVVVEGPHAGLQAAWDTLVFSARGLPRMRSVLLAFGLGGRDIDFLCPDDLEGRRAMVEVREFRPWSEDGREMDLVRNEVPYDGYRGVPP